MNKKIIGLCAAVLASATVVAQQEQEKVKVQKLNEVVVSDSRFELKRENSGKTVIKITTEELERSQGKTVAEIINTKSGFSIAGSTSRQGTVLGVFARGGRGRQVLIIIDGVRVSDPSSVGQEYDLRLLTAASIESIEIIKGAASTLYGTNAATAVINIITKKAAKDVISGNFQASVGTNQTAANQNFDVNEFANSARVSGTLDKFTYKVGFSNRYSDGLSAIVTPENEKDDFSNYSTDVNLGYTFSDKFSVNVYGNQTKNSGEYDESFGMLDAPYSFTSDQKRAGLSSTYKYNKGSVVINGAYSEYSSENKSAFPSAYEGKNIVVDVYNKYNFNDTFYTVLGVNYINDETEYAEIQDFSIVDPYANVVYVSDFGLNLNIGARLNNHSEYGSNFVYNFNPSYVIKNTNGYVKLMGSYATSYITPSLNQLFGNFGANPDLDPEEDRTIEGGLEYAANDKLRISALYFNRKEENFVFYGATGYDNAENTIEAKGVEVELNYTPIAAFNIGANYTFTEREGDAGIRLPKHKVNAFANYNFSDRTNASLNYTMVGNRSDSDFATFPATNVNLHAYTLLDLYISHTFINNKLTVFANASNLLNEEYTEILGFTTKGANVRLGLNLTL